MNTHYVLESLQVWTHMPFNMLELYSEFAVAQPVLAKSATSGTLRFIN